MTDIDTNAERTLLDEIDRLRAANKQLDGDLAITAQHCNALSEKRRTARAAALEEAAKAVKALTESKDGNVVWEAGYDTGIDDALVAIRALASGGGEKGDGNA